MPTVALLVDGPAVDAGDNAQALDQFGNPLITDGRGSVFTRIVDGDNDATATVDIGAFEVHTPGVVADSATQTIRVIGTEGDDVIQVNSATKRVVFAGVIHDFSHFPNPTFIVDGLGGEDRLFVDLTSGDELVHSGPFAVPALSFVLFDQNKKFVRLDEYCFRSLLEVFVLVPIWSVVLTLICLGCGFFDTAFFFEMGGRGSC